MMASEIQRIEVFHTALNADNVNERLSLVDEDVEVGGPRGSGRGAPLLKEWGDRTQEPSAPTYAANRRSHP